MNLTVIVLENTNSICDTKFRMFDILLESSQLKHVKNHKKFCKNCYNFKKGYKSAVSLSAQINFFNWILDCQCISLLI